MPRPIPDGPANEQDGNSWSEELSVSPHGLESPEDGDGSSPDAADPDAKDNTDQEESENVTPQDSVDGIDAAGVSRPPTEAVARAAIDQVFSTKLLFEQLDAFNQLESETRIRTLSIGAATAAATAFTVGYVYWTIRGGYIVASVLSAMTAWKLVDPLRLLVVDADRISKREKRASKRDSKRQQEEEETLESMF